jgi:osmoprotectant transport system permease protein
MRRERRSVARARTFGCAVIASAVTNRNPILRWSYFTEQTDSIVEALLQHLQLTLSAVGIGLIISAGLAAIAMKYRWTVGPITGTTAFLYTIPSVAFFGVLVPYTGNSATTAIVPLVCFTLLILVTNILDGFRAVPSAVKEAADGMGLHPARRIATVELPIAMPYIINGLRIATVTTVGLVTVAAIIGYGGLGRLILDGLRRAFWTPLTIGAGLSILLALLLDLMFYWLGSAVTPWTRRKRT